MLRTQNKQNSLKRKNRVGGIKFPNFKNYYYYYYKKEKRKNERSNWELPWWLSGKESACQCRAPGFDPWFGKIPPAAEQERPHTTATEPALQSPGTTLLSP